jgi:hypothetical protein
MARYVPMGKPWENGPPIQAVSSGLLRSKALPICFPCTALERENPLCRRVPRIYRYGDSNPGFRTENPAS